MYKVRLFMALAIADAMETINTGGNRNGNRGSKYLSLEDFSIIKNMPVGKAVQIAPFTEKVNGADVTLDAIAHRAKIRTVITNYMDRKAGDIPEFEVGVLADNKGIQVKKVQELRADAPAAVPAAGAAAAQVV